MANHHRSKTASFDKQPGQLRFFDSLVLQKIQFKGFNLALLFSFNQFLSFKPMLQSSSLWTSIGKIKNNTQAIRSCDVRSIPYA